MRRCELLRRLGTAAIAWPTVARAQQTGPARRIGVVMAYTDKDPNGQLQVTGFRDGLDQAFEMIEQKRVGAVAAASNPFFNNRRQQIIALAARHALPAIYEWREFTAAGGQMSDGASIADTYRQIGIYAGRILKGTRPADLPVLQPTKFELVLNLKTAKALHLDIPDRLLALADEVIE
jgi:ABC-type uncharacterized transport system substrate-binding protein